MKIYYLALEHQSEKNGSDIERYRSFHLMHNADELKRSISESFLNS